LPVIPGREQSERARNPGTANAVLAALDSGPGAFRAVPE
jgi:hypothetical protein